MLIKNAKNNEDFQIHFLLTRKVWNVLPSAGRLPKISLNYPASPTLL
jgi:hypothetical protein